MEIISYIVLILLSLVGYSAGAVSKAGKFAEIKPQILDLILILAIWTGALYSKTILYLNKWLLILIWVFLSIVIGMLGTIPRKFPREKSLRKEESEAPLKNPIKRLWEIWKNFSNRMGNFQTRIILSLFFFLLVSPFAFIVKVSSDPLRIKRRGIKSFWLPKKEIKIDLEQYRRQF